MPHNLSIFNFQSPSPAAWHWEPDNKEDYDIYWNHGHTRATQQPSTMTTEQAKYYKYPVFQAIMSHLQKFQR